MTKRFALVIDYELPDDVAPATFAAALEAMVAKIHETTPEPPANVTAYVNVSAELIAEAACAGVLLGQAERLQLQPDDVVKVTLGPEHGDEQHAEVLELLPQLFPEHRVVVLAHGATLEAASGDAT
ncbi:hypothetical protein GCM10027258_62710 [Amycolatopsis stemonae]